MAAFEKITKGNLSINKTLEVVFKENILAKSEAYLAYVDLKEAFLSELKNDEEYQQLKAVFNAGSNTLTKMAKQVPDLTEETFNEFHSNFKRERFYHELFSEDISFREVNRYYKYLNEECDFITMHKTKGSGIENVLVVLDEYFWNKYNFKFTGDSTEISSVFTSPNMKLFYVACSRTIKNLTVVKVVTKEEKGHLLKVFPEFEEVPINE
ncbi:hypothetical protein ACOBV9_15275 [Pseudoalteromonas espejiana]